MSLIHVYEIVEFFVTYWGQLVPSLAPFLFSEVGL